MGRMGSWSQQLRADRIESESEHEGVEELQQEAGVEQEQQQAGVEGENKGFTQKRGFEGDGGDRYRITIELLQELLHWYDIDQQPLSRHGKPLLILIGVHARLSNIDNEGYGIEDEAFEHKGQPVLRKAKTWAHGALKSWVELRRSNPVAREMLQHIELMPQPAGFQDTIISKWRIEQTAVEGQRFMSRDLNASYLSEGARKASFLSQEICHFEVGKITAVIQPTDTDVAFSYKALTNVESNRLKRELRDKAIEQNTQAVYRCGPYEVLRVVYQAHIKLQQQEVESQALLACLRRNGILA